MPFTRQTLGLAIAAVMTAIAPITAAADEHEPRAHAAHEHGAGKLNLAIEGSEVRLELNSPAANIVGFEHAASSERDRATLDQAVVLLRDGGRLFRFPEAAACRLVHVGLDSPLIEQDHDEAAAGHDEPHAEADAPDAGQGHGHEADDDRHADHDETHAEIEAEYHFACGHPERIDRIEVGLFEAFPATERLDVQFIVGGRQGAAVLSQSNGILRF